MVGGLDNKVFKKVLDEYLEGFSLKELLVKYEFHMKRQEFKTWLAKYELHGDACFRQKTNRSYTQAFKLQVINEYLNTAISLRQLVIKYNISSNAVVRRWVKKYTLREELKDYKPNPEVYKMTNKK